MNNLNLPTAAQNQNQNQVHEELLRLVKIERRLTSKILDLLQQLENRRSYLEWGFANLFDYLVRGLGYSEALAYQRKEALKICAVLPEVKQKIDQGSISLTTLARANRILNTKTTVEKRNLIQQLENKSTREIDQILARENPGVAPSPRRERRHVAERKVQVTFELTTVELQTLDRLKALKSHKIKNLKELFLMLAERELENYNHTSKLPSKSKSPRQIKISLKNHLLQQSKYKCQYPGCEQTHFLQVDHIVSVSQGGTNHPSNLQVLCQAHNLFKYRQTDASKEKSFHKRE